MKIEANMTPDIVVVGSGIAGLTTAKMLTEHHYSVAVVEQASVIASGATTRNEGWLHAGSYHAVAVENPLIARLVVQRSQFGHEYIQKHVPECIEDSQSSTYALIKDQSLVDTAEQRWRELGVTAERLTSKVIANEAPEVTSEHAASYKVKDTSINTRVLCERLAHDIQTNGGTIFTNTRFSPQDDEHATIEHPLFGKIKLHAGLYIVTAGAAIKGIIEKITGEPFPMRFIKSHLLVVPRLTKPNVFFVDPGEAGVMNHGETSVVGLNRDGIQHPEPDYAVVQKKEEEIKRAVERLVPPARFYYDRGVTIACIKPDLFTNKADPMNVNVVIREPFPGYIAAVPGKMTEAPYLAKTLLEAVQHRDSLKSINSFYTHDNVIEAPLSALRPCDVYIA